MLKLQLEYLKIALSTAMEYKINFITQILAIILNDIVWLIFWFIFFNKFNVINGWIMSDIIMLYAIATTAHGLGGFFYGNRLRIANLIAKGKLDFYLTLPKNRLYHLLISRSSFYALGDVLFGLILAIVSLSVTQIPLYIILTLSSTIIFISFAIIVNSLAFYMGNAEITSKYMFFGLLTIATYPITIFQGITKFIILTIIPAGFITGVPIQLLKKFDIWWFSATIGFAILSIIIAILVFNHGLRKYESGNLMYVRT